MSESILKGLPDPGPKCNTSEFESWFCEAWRRLREVYGFEKPAAAPKVQLESLVSEMEDISLATDKWRGRKSAEAVQFRHEYGKNFSAALRRAMVLCGCSRGDLSEVTGLSVETLDRYLNGLWVPRITKIEKIADALMEIREENEI